MGTHGYFKNVLWYCTWVKYFQPLTLTSFKHYKKTRFLFCSSASVACSITHREDLDLIDSPFYLFDLTHLLKQPCSTKIRDCLLKERAICPAWELCYLPPCSFQRGLWHDNNNSKVNPFTLTWITVQSPLSSGSMLLHPTEPAGAEI